jgi:hypothetical protein
MTWFLRRYTENCGKSAPKGRWYFGQVSETGGLQFWKMDLDGDPTDDSLWKQSRSRCEALAHAAACHPATREWSDLEGLDGLPHVDDVRQALTPCAYQKVYPDATPACERSSLTAPRSVKWV